MDEMDKIDEMKIVTQDVGEEKRQNGDENEKGMSQVDGIKLPRVSIQFCTQCKWMLRAAYFAQELLSTFGTDIGEVALQPSTGGTFIVELFTDANANKSATRHVEGEAGKNVDEVKDVKVLKHTLWDRKSEGGFPETKELKKRLRNIIDPSRDLGHVDGKKSTTSKTTPPTSNSAPTSQLQSSAQQDSAPTDLKASTSTPASAISQPPASSPVSTAQLIEAKPEEVKEKKQEEEKVTLNERGKIVITGLEGEGGFGDPLLDWNG
ncbi:putative selenoprotein w family protein [Botrytis fragariae]|uniref:Putative selenoprotein w family protein n=1 Tax=Botrytis fragariae TaxID=1964551 RepID=A0A8H6EIV2_9HELO|nr:putative selenoprotein w family protein [Botrytis fragariae]KAF5873857.1 putative selenoprotein w family protein [Botrytis fragariae]